MLDSLPAMSTAPHQTVSRFLKLLHTISRKLQQDEFKEMKCLCYDRVPQGDLESVSIPMELFIKLCDLDIISETNGSFLVEILNLCGRTDLCQQVSKFFGITAPKCDAPAEVNDEDPQHLLTDECSSTRLPHTEGIRDGPSLTDMSPSIPSRTEPDGKGTSSISDISKSSDESSCSHGLSLPSNPSPIPSNSFEVPPIPLQESGSSNCSTNEIQDCNRKVLYSRIPGATVEVNSDRQSSCMATDGVEAKAALDQHDFGNTAPRCDAPAEVNEEDPQHLLTNECSSTRLPYTEGIRDGPSLTDMSPSIPSRTEPDGKGTSSINDISKSSDEISNSQGNGCNLEPGLLSLSLPSNPSPIPSNSFEVPPIPLQESGSSNWSTNEIQDCNRKVLYNRIPGATVEMSSDNRGCPGVNPSSPVRSPDLPSRSLSLTLPSSPLSIKSLEELHINDGYGGDHQQQTYPKEIIDYSIPDAAVKMDCDRQSSCMATDGVETKAALDQHDLDAEMLVDDSSEDSDQEDISDKEKQIPWRKYQLELARPALEGKNCIICSPTGSGKTYTAGYILQKLYKNVMQTEGSFKALFIVNNRHLTLQQRNSLREVFGRDSKRVQKIGENFTLDTWILKYDIIVLTAQILLNALEYHRMNISDFDILIFDECHHTDQKHPYQQIMNKYLKQKVEVIGSKLPQILGLTASLGTGSRKDASQHFVTLCSNLDCPTITHVKDNIQELLEYNPKPSKDQIIAVSRRASNKFSDLLQHLMRKIENRVDIIKPRDLLEYGSYQYINWIVEMREAAEASENMRHIHVACRALEHLNASLMCYQEHRAKYVMGILEDYFYIPKLGAASLKVEEEIFGYFASIKAALWKIADSEVTGDNEKLLQLQELLSQQYAKDKESKGILLVHTRMSVQMFMKFFSEHELMVDAVHACYLMGQQRDGIQGNMTEYEQQLALRKFQKGNDEPDSANLLVATDIAQEGLDMPKCNFVIRYNFVSNEIGTVQSKGRARAKNSECYLIVERNSINHQRELENLQNEHHMVEMLHKWDQQEIGKLHQKIKQLQEATLEKLRLEREKELECQKYNPEEVGVHCKECKELLARGSDILKKGPHFICTGSNFTQKTLVHTWHRKKEFRYEYQLGTSLCISCKSSLGTVVNYKKGTRRVGYTLAKDAIRFCLSGQKSGQKIYTKCRKWSEAPFKIPKEDLCEEPTES